MKILLLLLIFFSTSLLSTSAEIKPLPMEEKKKFLLKNLAEAMVEDMESHNKKRKLKPIKALEIKKINDEMDCSSSAEQSEVIEQRSDEK